LTSPLRIDEIASKDAVCLLAGIRLDQSGDLGLRIQGGSPSVMHGLAGFGEGCFLRFQSPRRGLLIAFQEQRSIFGNGLEATFLSISTRGTKPVACRSEKHGREVPRSVMQRS